MRAAQPKKMVPFSEHRIWRLLSQTCKSCLKLDQSLQFSLHIKIPFMVAVLIMSVPLSRIKLFENAVAGYQTLENLIQRKWECIHYFVTGNQFILTVVGSWIIMITVYWAIGILFTFVDITGKPKAFLRYKIQDSKLEKYPVPLEKLKKVVYQVLKNQTLVAIPTITVCHYIRYLRGYDDSLALPSVGQILLNLVTYILIEEILFYYGHRLLHHPRLYKHYHKRHHEWISPIAISAIYCHPVEHIVSNLLPTLLGPALMGHHVFSQWIWLLLATPFGVIVHAGYHLPFLPSPEAHDFHHLKFNVNYGMIGLLDRIHGTDELFRKSVAARRHILMLSLHPIKESIPDVETEVIE